MAPQPYTISVPQEKVDNLKTKLSLANFPDELDSSAWDLGVPLSDVTRLIRVWENWDWRQAEEKLNKVPQYHTGIKVDGYDELDIHFVWQKSEVKNAIPLLFVHGCKLALFTSTSSIIRVRYPREYYLIHNTFTTRSLTFQRGLGVSSRFFPFFPCFPRRAALLIILLLLPSRTTGSRKAQSREVSHSLNTPRHAID